MSHCVAAGFRAGAAVARRGGRAVGGAAHVRGMVPAVAEGQFGRQHAGHGRHGCHQGGLRAAGSEFRAQCVPRASLGVVGGWRHPCAVRNVSGRVRRERAGTRGWSYEGCRKAYSAGRAGILWLRDVEHGLVLLSGSCMEPIQELGPQCDRRVRDGLYLGPCGRRSGSGGKRRRVCRCGWPSTPWEGVADAEPLYRAVTKMLEPERRPGRELVAL